MPLALGLGNGLPFGGSQVSGAALLLAGESDGLALDFTFHNGSVGDAQVKDTSTPGNIFRGTPYDLLTYSSPSVKMCMQSDGTLKHGAHNLLTYSDLDTTGWTEANGVNQADNTNPDPDGGNNAIYLKRGGTASATQQTAQAISGAVSGTIYCCRVRAKANDYNFLTLNLFDGSAHRTFFNLSTGAVATNASGNTASIEDLGDGWYLCSIRRTIASTTPQTIIGFAETDNVAAFSGSIGEGVFVYEPAMYHYPMVDEHLKTTTAAKYQLPYEWDTSGNSLGILVEEQRTNLLLNNRTLNNASGGWTETNATVSLNNTTGIDGETSMDKIEATAGGACSIARTFTGTAAAYTFSAIVKNDDCGWCVLGLNDGTTNETKNFNIASGALGSDGANAPNSSGIEDLGGGFYRCWIVSTMAATTCTATLSVTDADSASDPDAGEGLFADLLQVELGAFKTSPVVTGSATVTRAADNITLALSATPLPDMTNSAHVISAYAEASNNDVGSASVFAIDDGSNNDRLLLFTTGASESINLDTNTTDAGGASCSILVAGATAGVDRIMACRFAEDDCAISVNGLTQGTDTSSDVQGSAVTTIRIGSTAAATGDSNNHIGKIAIVPSEWSDATLEEKVGN